MTFEWGTSSGSDDEFTQDDDVDFMNQVFLRKNKELITLCI
jgi:hypothetical protein